MEGISDEVLEVARNLFDGGDIDYNIDRYGKATVNTEELPDLDNYEYTYGTTRAEILQQAIDLIVKILPNVTFYNDYNDTGIYLELSDNHTFWDINEPEGFDGEFDYDLYNFFVEQAFDEFENQTGVELYQCGRSGRHICVEVNFDNILNYDNLCKTQAELEQQVIGEAESNCFGQALEEAKDLAPDEKIAKCLSCGMKIKYKNRDVQHDAMGDYIECPNCHSTFDVDYDNTPTKKTEDLSPAEEIDLADDINTYLMKNQLYPVDVFAADTRVMVEIEWGDWKHDHLRCDALMKAKGYTLVEEEVTEEDGSDCFSAIRHYEPKGKFKDIKTEAEDYSTFTPTNKVLSGNKGLSEKAISEMRWSLPDLFKDMTDEQKQIWEELSLRGMVMSCLIYGEDIHTSTVMNAVSKYYKQPYVNEYYDTLGKDVTEEIIKQQTEYFNKGKVIKDVGTDSDGLSYNSFVEPKDESKKVTEAEDMTQVKDDIETAVEKSDSTDLEKDQVKGSIDVLKTDEESAIEGYEDFTDETEKVADKELADAVNNQMEEIIDDEKEHIEKLDTIKSALGESKKVEEVSEEDVIADFNFGKNWRAVITRCTNADDSDKVSFYDLSAPKNKFPQGEDMENTYSIDTLLMHKSAIIDDGQIMYKDYTSRKFVLSGKDMEDFFNKLEKIKGIYYGKDFEDGTDYVDKYSAADKEIAELSKSIPKEKWYEEVKINYECMECGEKFSHTESVSDKELEELEGSTPDWVPDCPNCDTNEWVEMRSYEILDTIKSALGENKKTEAELKRNNSKKRLDYKLDGFKGVNIIVVDKKNNIDTEDYMKFGSMEFGIDEYEFKDSMISGIKDVLTNLYEFSDAYYDDVFTEDEINEMAEDITQDVLQLYDDLPDELIDFENGIADLSSIKSTLDESKEARLTGDETYVARNSSGYKSIGLIVNNKTKQFQIINGQVMTTDSKTKKMSKKQIRAKAQQLYDNGYTEYDGYGSVAQGVEKKTESAPADVIEYFGMQDNTDEEFKNNVAKEYKTLRAKYPDKEMILNGDFGTYLGTEKATPVEKGKYITVYESKEVKTETVKIMAYGKLYYEYSNDEWNSKSEDEKDATIIDVVDQATEEEGHTVYEDEVEVITENRKVTEAKDDLESIKNLIVYEKTQDIFEELYHNKHLDCEYNGSNGVVKITSADEQTFNIIDEVMVDKLHYSKLSNYIYELNEGPIYRDIKGGFDFKGYSYKVDVKFSLNEKDTVVGTVGISKIDVKKENKNLTEDITSKDVDEIFSKYAETPVTVKNLKQKWASASDEMHGVIAGGWSAIITGNNFKIKVVNSLKLSGYKISGENIEEAEKAARKIYINATDIGYNTGLYESKEVKTEKMGKDADKKYSNLYKYKGKAFAYDNENAIVEYVYVDPDDNSWIVLDEIGLSNDNWDNKEARDEYLDEYIAQLDDEANRLADDFIANEYLGESLASRYVKTENKSIKTEASEGTATLDANSDLLPIINMYQYDLYNMCDDLVPPPNSDMSKDVDEAMLDIAEPIIETEIKGVLPSAKITFKEYKHPKYYKLFSNLNDVLYFDITYNVAEYEALKEKAIKDPEFEQYLKDHYKSYDGFMSFFADNLTAFNQQEEWKQFVSVLSYYLPNDDEQNYNTLLSDTYDKLLEMGYEPVDSIVDGLVDNITDRANDGEMTLNKDTVTQYIKELYGDVDQYDYILDEVLNGLSLSESKKVTEAEVTTATKSAGEYWVGDPCYVVPDDIYQGIWGDKYKFKDGTIDCGNGLSFQVHGTAWGDGEYKGSNGFIYGVDAGVLAIVPMELATKERGLDKGTRHKSSTAKLEYKDGVFNMIFDNETITINTDPSEDLDESKQLKKEEYEVRQDYYDPETGEAVRNEYVMSFDTWEEAQRFADGLAQDPNCTAWVNDTSKDESKKIEDKELLTENDEIPVVNPDEQDYYNNKGYIISLYPRSRSNVSII